ncbi:MAG: M3 family oligoendopeptidase [Cytophagaceae bacterium]
MSHKIDLKKKERRFLQAEFRVDSWDNIESCFKALADREITSKSDLRSWFQDRSELEAVLSEEMGWRYIRMTCDTANQELVDSFNYFVSKIQPKVAPYSNLLDKKALELPFLDEFKEKEYVLVRKIIEKEARIFREENIPLNTEIQTEEQKFGSISGDMTVEMEGKELTLQQAADYLQSLDRDLRKEAYFKIAERRLKDKDALNDLFDKLLSLRDQVAKNAGFSNFRDYMHVSLGRFAYTPEDCFKFHEAVSSEVVPVLNELALQRKEALSIDVLRPWDLNVNYHGKKALKPFTSGDDLLDKTLTCFYKIDTYLGDCLATMKEIGHLDLVSRKGKAPGGYNYPLDETGVPFIFMNATSNLQDLVTMVHEGGHALHSFLNRDLELTIFKHPPSEVAELASMAMELISMEHWDVFFDNEEDLIRAKREHLESIIGTLPWVATVDKFQHWIYENPQHSQEEREQAWNSIFSTFSNQIVDWSGLEQFKNYIWHKQLHIYEVPFYYIEYAIAQLAAIGVWKNYKEDPKGGFQKYINALKLGYTRPINEIYATAGVRFDFSGEYIRELIGFVKGELDLLKK